MTRRKKSAKGAFAIDIKAKPLIVAGPARELQEQATHRWTISLKRIVRDVYNVLIGDGQRYKEAKIRQEEFQALKLQAEAEKTSAEAMKIMLDAQIAFEEHEEKKRAQARELMKHRELQESDEIAGTINFSKSQVRRQAEKKVAQAIRQIEDKGGNVEINGIDERNGLNE
jgi:hypothetical protein